MAPPSRPQIEATITQPSYTVEYYSAGWNTVSDNYVLSVSGLVNAGGGSSGLDFGATASPRITIELDDNSTTAAIAWNQTRVRVSFGFAGSDELVRMTGIIIGRTRSWGLSENSLTWDCAGFDALISATPLYSEMFYRRLAATATGASTVEDPTNGGYAAGLVNYIFWQAGGRPLAQAGTYTSAVFYYECANALMGPEWSWIAGEDAWAELDRLCRACGGQVYQKPDGTMVYSNPLAPTAGAYTLTTAAFEGASQEETTTEYFTSARCSYTARALQPTQVVYEDTTPRVVAPSGTLVFTVEPQLPVYAWSIESTDTIPASHYVCTDYFGVPMTPDATYSDLAAARAELTFENTDATKPMIISRISLHAQPVAPVETGQAQYGSGTPERQIGDGEIYVQSRTHAERLVRIYVDVYGVVRPTRTFDGMGYDPDRELGEVIAVTLSDWSLSSTSHRITEIAPSDTGATMSLKATPLTGIPLASELFMIGTSYSNGDTRKLGY